MCVMCVSPYSHIYLPTHLYPYPITGFRRIEIIASPFSPLSLKKINSLILFLLYRWRNMLTDWVTDTSTTSLLTAVKASPWPWLCFYWHESQSLTSMAAISRDLWSEWSLVCCFCLMILLDIVLAFLPPVCDWKFNSWNTGYICTLDRWTVFSVICHLQTTALSFPSFNKCFTINVNFCDDSKDNKS